MKVNPKKCPQNHPCPAIKACPVKAIRQVNNKLPFVDDDKCIDCAKCVTYCPMGAFYS